MLCTTTYVAFQHHFVIDSILVSTLQQQNLQMQSNYLWKVLVCFLQKNGYGVALIPYSHHSKFQWASQNTTFLSVLVFINRPKFAFALSQTWESQNSYLTIANSNSVIKRKIQASSMLLIEVTHRQSLIVLPKYFAYVKKWTNSGSIITFTQRATKIYD